MRIRAEGRQGLPSAKRISIADSPSTTNTTGQTTSGPEYYFPYGGKRGGSEVATEYQYTGQRWTEALGLYFYNARWYDPSIRRFAQPDTVVPEPGNPQSLNRYTYALNNPVKNSDPSGHWVPETATACREQVLLAPDIGRVGVEFGSTFAGDLRKNTLKTTAGILAQRVGEHLNATLNNEPAPEGSVTAAEANIAIVRQGVRLSRNQTDVFMEDVGQVLAGYQVDPMTNLRLGGSGPAGKYQTNIAGSQGFRPEYQDPYGPEKNQTVHFWYYVRYSYEAGYAWAQAGNIYHELRDRDSGSWEDYWLGIEGADLGTALRDFEQYGLSPSDIEAWLRAHIYQPTP